MFGTSAEILASKQGSLAETPFPLLLHALLLEQRSCVLELRVRQLEKRIWLEEGSPVACQSNLLHETLGKFLVERGKLTEQQYQTTLNDSVTSGTPMEALLVNQGLIAPFDLYKQLQANLAHQILDSFRWADASYRLVEATERATNPIKMNVLQLILTGAVGVLPFEVVGTHFAFFDEQRFSLVAAPAHELADLKLTARDARLVQVLRSRPTFAEVVERSGFDTEQAMRRLYALGVLGLVELLAGAEEATVGQPSREPEEAAGVRAVAAPLAPSVARGADSEAPGRDGQAMAQVTVGSPRGEMSGSASTPARSGAGGIEKVGRVDPVPAFSDDDEASKNALAAAFLELRRKDPFDLLGVSANSQPLAVRNAFLGLADRFSPQRFRSSELKEKAEELLLAHARAFASLSDPEQLALHRQRRQIASEAKKAPARASTADQFRIRTTLLDASSQFSEGLKRLEAGSFRGAIEYFEYAYDIEPRARHRAFLAWSRYKHNPQSYAKLALQELGEASKAEPDCEEAWSFAGEIHSATGQIEAAEESYRRAYKANPGNRRYPELLRDLGRQRRK